MPPMQLLDLPDELLALIVQHCDDDSFFATRLVERTLENASLTLFGRRFFRKKGYMLTTPSLRVLKEVAYSAKLRKYVQHVWFNPDCYTFVTPACAPEDDIDCDDAEDEDEDNKIEIIPRVDLLSDEDRRKWDAYLEVVEDHERLLAADASLLESRLTDIFARLPNAKILGMRRSEDHSPWGWRSLQRKVGEDPRVLGPIPSSPMHCLSDTTKLFKALMAAVASSQLRLQRLYIDAIEVDNMPAIWLKQTNIEAALKSMLYLEINVSVALLPLTSSPHFRVDRMGTKHGTNLVKILRAAAPSLLEFGLQVFREPGRPNFANSVAGVDTWKQHSNQYLAFQRIVDDVRFEHLTRVKLEKIVTTSGALEAFLQPSQEQLVSLKMRDIRLLPDDGNVRPWESIFTFFRFSIPRLEYLLLFQLLYSHGGISFVETPPRYSTGPVLGGNAATSFREYEHLALEATGRDEVLKALEKVAEKHWYIGNVYGYAMDEDLWHTDTSDEEW